MSASMEVVVNISDFTDVAAWWGACVASLVFMWDVYRWAMSGARLRVRVSPDNEFVTADRLNEFRGKTFVWIAISNIGDAKTTLESVTLAFYPSRLARVLRKPTERALAMPALAEPFPFPLGAGERWTGGVLQTERIEGWIRDGFLFCQVSHSTSVKPVEVLIRPSSGPNRVVQQTRA